MASRALSKAPTRLVVVAFLAGCGCGSDAERTAVPPATTTEPSAWTTYEDRERGFAIRFPASWKRAAESLTPILEDPSELVSIGTRHPRPGGKRGAHLPVNALDDLGPNDAFLTIQERARPRLPDYPPRPTRFELGGPDEGFDGVGCVQEATRLRQWWLWFRDGDRAFYALVALGASASEDTRRRLLETLNSFQVD